MSRIVFAALGTTLAALVAAHPAPARAQAQTVCGERTKFLEHLGKSYAESPVAMGLASNGSILEVLASEKGTWTIIITMPNGVSCVVASGEAWEEVSKVALGPAA